MIIKWNPSNDFGMSEIEAIPGVYDASLPTSSFLMNANPREVDSDKVAVAAVLAFGEFIAGPVEFPFSVSPMVAEAITRLVAPVSVFVDPINFEPRAITNGPNVFSKYGLGNLSTQRMRVIEFRQRPVEDAFGSSFHDNILSVSTNARHFSFWPAASHSLDGGFTKPELAAMVLLSDDYGVGYIDMPRAADPFVIGLLKSCGLSVVELG